MNTCADYTCHIDFLEPDLTVDELKLHNILPDFFSVLVKLSSSAAFYMKSHFSRFLW